MGNTDADTLVKSIMRFTVEVNFFAVTASVGSGVCANGEKAHRLILQAITKPRTQAEKTCALNELDAVFI